MRLLYGHLIHNGASDLLPQIEFSEQILFFLVYVLLMCSELVIELQVVSFSRFRFDEQIHVVLR